MATKQTNPRRTPGYQAWRKKVLATCEPICIRCGFPVDMTLASTHPDGPTADHEPPLALTGEATPSIDGAGIAHLRCNRSHGGRLGNKLAQDRRATSSKRSKQPRRDSLDDPSHTPAAPSPISPRSPKNGQGRPVEPRYHQSGHILPRLETKPPATVTGSYGGHALAWVKEVYGVTLRGWQAYALDRALEHDADGELIWPTVLVTVGRQSGKSYLSRAVCLWRMHNAELFGETQTVLHVANRRQTAIEVMRPAGFWAMEQYGKRAVKWGNMEAGIELPSGDRWIVHAANESAGVGYSASMIFVDEAWKIDRSVVDDSLAPTLAEKRNPQLWLVSTAGDSKSDLMQAYRQRALDRLDDPQAGGVLLLEWSAPADADPDDVKTWKWASPEWSPKREQFLRQQWANVEESAWRKEYLNQWVLRANHWLRDSAWMETLDADLDLPTDRVWSVALEADFDGMGHAVAIACPLEDDLIGIRVSVHRTIKEADERLTEIKAANPRLAVYATPGYVDRLTHKIDSLVGNREAAAATQTLLDYFDRRKIRHDGSQTLREHFANTTISRRQGGWVLTAPMGSSGVYGARAAMFAVQQATKTPKASPVIRSRRRA